MMDEQRTTVGLAKPSGRPSKEIGLFKNPIYSTPSLADAGIDKILAEPVRAPKAKPEPMFEIAESKCQIATN